MNRGALVATDATIKRWLRMIQPETYRFVDDGCFPNSALPLLVYHDAMVHDAAGMKQVSAGNEWSNDWQDGIFS